MVSAGGGAAAPRIWRLLRDGAATPAHNMAVDEALLHSADPRAVLRLYAWDPPGLSLGYFQPLESFDVRAAEAAGAVVVRRLTGGGAIHHERELTFAIAARPGHDGYPADVVEAYTLVHALLSTALAALGVRVEPRGGDAPLSTRPRAATLCFEDHTALDLLDASGRKLVGSAQRRTGGRVLHHGSVPLEAPALTPGCSSVSLVAGRPVAWDEVADAVQDAFAQGLDLRWQPDVLAPAEAAAARALAAGRYARP